MSAASEVFCVVIRIRILFHLAFLMPGSLAFLNSLTDFTSTNISPPPADATVHQHQKGSMSLPSSQTTPGRNSSSYALTTTYVLVVFFMANLNAVMDFFFHPDIPYLDHEHLLVGAVSGVVSGILIGLVSSEVRSLRKALDAVRSLESILPICSFCKKIREPDRDPKQQDSWHPIEKYIGERTSSEFTHGVCPDCMSKYFPADPPRK